MGIVRLLMVLAFMLMVSSVVAEKGSPKLYKVAKGAIIEVDVPFPGKSTVHFRDGQLLGFFSGNTWAIKCDMNFKGRPADEISTGRYEVTKARNREVSMGSDDYVLVTTLTLKTLSGSSASDIQCTQTGSYNDVGSAYQVSPVTVQQFKRTVGKYLTLTLSEDVP